MNQVMKKVLLTTLGLGLLSLPAAAGVPKSMTKTLAGISYKLTVPNPLAVGQQKLTLKLMRGAQAVSNAKLTAIVLMADGMKSPVVIKPRPNGELELMTKFGMGGEWQLKLQQSAPVKAQIIFDLNVEGSMGKMTM